MKKDNQIQDDFLPEFDYKKFSETLLGYHLEIRKVVQDPTLLAQYLNSANLYGLLVDLIRGNPDLVSGKSLDGLKELVAKQGPALSQELYFPIVRSKRRPTVIKEEIGYSEVVTSILKITGSLKYKDDNATVVRDINSYLERISNPEGSTLQNLRYVVDKYKLNVPKDIQERLK